MVVLTYGSAVGYVIRVRAGDCGAALSAAGLGYGDRKEAVGG